jgi:hypothetical protein
MNPIPLFLIIVTLPLLLGGCGEKAEVKTDEPVAKVKPVEEAPINSIKYKITGDEVAITDYDTEASGELTIPATIEGKTVTSIGEQTFYNCTSLTGITIPDSVTSIGNSAFSRCASLTNITIPDSLTSIGDGAFAFCTSLANITIPGGVTSIGEQTFYNCTSLTGITIPDSVTSIGRYAFSSCRSLTSITIPNSVTSIGESALMSCNRLTNITIGDSVTSIGSSPFAECGKLNTVTFHGDAPRARSYTFLNSTPTIYRKPEAKGWGDTWGGRPVKLISEKP